LNSKFIAKKLCSVVKHSPNISVVALQQMDLKMFNYEIKYGKAWRAKQRALKHVFGDWEEAYERLSIMLNAMKDANHGMHVEYLAKDKVQIAGERCSLGLSGHFHSALKASSIVGSYCPLMVPSSRVNTRVHC
jgi:hypothetical protein